MNRRIFLSQPMLLYYKQTAAPSQRNNDIVFESRNKRMSVKMTYLDYDSHVLVINETNWYDPISEDVKSSVDKKMYILESFES